jgi:hypothetical protein
MKDAGCRIRIDRDLRDAVLRTRASRARGKSFVDSQASDVVESSAK